ncbi:MAG: precorrin-8X methylmutase [Pseudomonadota bacterium]
MSTTRNWLLRDPNEIAARERALIAAEARLDHLPDWLHEAAVALILASGMVDLPNRLAWSPDLGERLQAALAAGAPVFCDSPALAVALERHTITKRPETGAIALIGTDALALADLLARVRRGEGRPAAVIALPAGLVNAAEAKAALAAAPMGLAYLTLRGRRGGAGLAAAAFTALAGTGPCAGG